MVNDARMYLIHEEVMEELAKADEKYGPMPEPIEGFHTLACEVAELHREVMRKNKDPKAMRAEAIQVDAMVKKLIRDCC